MLRKRLAIAMAGLALLVLVQGAGLYWSSQRAEHLAQHRDSTVQIAADLLDLSVKAQRGRTRDDLLASLSRARMSAQAAVELWRAAPRWEPDRVEQRRRALDMVNAVTLLEGRVRAASELQPRADAVPDTARLIGLVDAAVERSAQAVPAARAAASEAFETLRLLALNALLVSIACLLAAAVIAWQVRARLRRLIDALLEATRALQSGSLAHRIEAADTELGRVAAGFNAMASELEQHRRSAEATQAQLAHAVQARTSELRSTHATLQVVDARRRQFLEDISHELRTPATAIRGEAEIALRGPEKPAQEYKLALQRVITIVQQMGVLIDDLLLLARVAADQQMLRRVAVPWLDTLREAADLAEALGHEQQVEIRFEAVAENRVEAGDPLLAHADPDRLRQALMIVLDNAVRYSQARGRVTIAWRAEDNELCAIVRDQGIGIDTAELPSLFVRHARGARARAHRADGSGLGLAIAQGIMQAHGGRIGIESRPGAGTTVLVSVPRWRGGSGEVDEPAGG